MRNRSSDRDAASGAELRVLLALASGLTAKEIGAAYGVSPSTVRYHLTNLKIRLGARSLAQLGAMAVAKGLVQGFENPMGSPFERGGHLTRSKADQ